MDAYTLSRNVWTRLNGTPGITMFEGEATATPHGKYGIYHPTAGHTYQDRLADKAESLRWEFRVVACGTSPVECLAAADLIRARLSWFRPNPANPAASPLREDRINAPLIKDTTVPDDIRYSLTLTYQMTTPR